MCLSATVFTLYEPIAAQFLGGTTHSRPRLKETPKSGVTICCHKNRVWGQQQWRFHHFSLHRFDTIQQCDRQTDWRTPRGWL